MLRGGVPAAEPVSAQALLGGKRAALALVLFCGVVALQYAGLNPLELFPGTLSTRTNYEFQGTIGNSTWCPATCRWLCRCCWAGSSCGSGADGSRWYPAGWA